MRIRSIRPEFFTSTDVGAMTRETRLLFIGLWAYVDDNGVGRDEVALIAADLYPFDLSRDSRETLASVSEGISTLCEGGQIVRYEVDGRRFLHITAWGKHQRIDKPSKERYPLPTCENAVIRETSASPRETVASAPEKLPVGEGEKGRRGEVEKLSSDQPPAEREGFAEFYAAYPRKVQRRAAAKAYAAARKRATADAILDGARRLAADPNLPESTFIPHPSTWLNGDGWDDGPLPQRRYGGTSSRPKVNAAGYELPEAWR